MPETYASSAPGPAQASEPDRNRVLHVLFFPGCLNPRPETRLGEGLRMHLSDPGLGTYLGSRASSGSLAQECPDLGVCCYSSGLFSDSLLKCPRVSVLHLHVLSAFVFDVQAFQCLGSSDVHVSRCSTVWVSVLSFSRCPGAPLQRSGAPCFLSPGCPGI